MAKKCSKQQLLLQIKGSKFHSGLLNQINSTVFFNNSSKQQQLSISDFAIGRKLSEGKVGKVYLAKCMLPEVKQDSSAQNKANQNDQDQDQDGGFIVALKILSISAIRRHRLQRQVAAEIEIQGGLLRGHKRILQLYTYFWDADRVYLVLEYAPKGELYAVLQRAGRFSDGVASRIVDQVIEALHFCHAQGVIHRDLKPENLLLDYHGQVKLADFGWSSVAGASRRFTRCGTLDYLAPEILELKVGNGKDALAGYDYRVDLWCLGVLAYELLTGRPPFNAASPAATKAAIVQVKYDLLATSAVSNPSPESKRSAVSGASSASGNTLTSLSPFACSFIRALLVRRPEERMSLEQAAEHLWIHLYRKKEEEQKGEKQQQQKRLLLDKLPDKRLEQMLGN